MKILSIILLSLLLPLNLIFAMTTSYDKVIRQLELVVQENPQTISMLEIGRNDQEIPIYAVVIGSEQAKQSRNSTHHLIVAAHHGNERLSVDVALQVITDLISQANSDSQKKIDPDVIYHVIPVLNIGGYNTNNRYENDQFGVSQDPNRDYPDVCAVKQDFKLASTQALRDYIHSNTFSGSVTIHGYIGTLTFPWGMYTDNSHTHDHKFFNRVATEVTRTNNYRVGTHADIIYPAVGTFEDWIYAEYGIWSVLLELDYSADIKTDSAAIIQYLSLIPKATSRNHRHAGTCRKPYGVLIGRP